jgi:hypothetical protein
MRGRGDLPARPPWALAVQGRASDYLRRHDLDPEHFEVGPSEVSTIALTGGDHLTLVGACLVSL